MGASGTFLLIHKAVDLVLALVVVGWLTEIELDALKDQEKVLNNYFKWKTAALLVEPPFVHCSAGGTKVRESEPLQAKSSYQENFTNPRISLEYGRLAWYRY